MLQEKELKDIARCPNSKFIYNKYLHRRIFVPCGHCDFCLAKKANRQFHRTSVASTKFKHCYFVTLTYSNEYIPLYKIYGAHHDDDFAETPFGRHPMISTDVLPLSDFVKKYDVKDNDQCLFFFKQVQGTQPFDKELQQHMPSETSFSMPLGELRAMIKRSTPQTPFCMDDVVPFLQYVDVQNYIKRLRINLNRAGCNEKISFYAVGEYGPVHYRPHFHLLLFGNTEEFTKNVCGCHARAWKFGRSDIQYSAGGSTSYVSSYVSSLANCPAILKVCAGFRPKSRASFGFYAPNEDLNLSADADEVSKKINRSVIGRSYNLNGKTFRFSASNEYISTLLPRFASVRMHDYYGAANLIMSYLRLPQILARFGYLDTDISTMSMARAFVSYCSDIEAQTGVQYDNDMCALLAEANSLLPLGGSRSLFGDLFLQRVYRLLLKMRKFVSLWSVHLSRTPYNYLLMIFRVGYKILADNEYSHLKQFMLKYESLTATTDIPDFYFFDSYDTPLSPTAEDLKRIDEIAKEIVSYSARACADKVKHKKMNDALNILNN